MVKSNQAQCPDCPCEAKHSNCNGSKHYNRSLKLCRVWIFPMHAQGYHQQKREGIECLDDQCGFQERPCISFAFDLCKFDVHHPGLDNRAYLDIAQAFDTTYLYSTNTPRCILSAVCTECTDSVYSVHSDGDEPGTYAVPMATGQIAILTLRFLSSLSTWPSSQSGWALTSVIFSPLIWIDPP